MTDHLTKIEALNNVDIRCGMLHDSEVRVWVNCNWVLDYIYDVRPSHKKQVGIFEHLNNSQMERFWKEFNHSLPQHEGFALVSSEVTCGMAEALLETWETHIQELKDDEYNDDCWNLAKAEYKNDQDE
tara:strand:- start:70 stop:453 length:384 start_codon:yes stop_codon:yes gene_type:complete